MSRWYHDKYVEPARISNSKKGGNQSIFKCRPDSKAFGLTLADVVLVSVLAPLIGPLFLYEAETRGPGDALPALRYLTVLDSLYVLV